MKELDDIVTGFAERAAEDAHYALMEIYGNLQDACESPIEKAVLAGFICASLFINTKFPGSMTVVARKDFAFTQDLPRGHAVAIAQCTIDQYRVDFLFARHTMAGAYSYIAVECDGHEFHEKTKEQAQRDKRRDRALLMRGIKVMRFTGSEIWRDPQAVLTEVFNLLAAELKTTMKKD